jgi:hypothetical protein
LITFGRIEVQERLRVEGLLRKNLHNQKIPRTPKV